MFATRGQKLLLIILVMVAALSVMASWLLFKPEAGTALAQGGGEGDKKTDNYEAWQAALESHGPGDMISTEGSAIGPQSDGSGVEVVSIGAFRNDGDSVDGWFNLFSGGYIRNNDDVYACFMAPTYPPDGATLTEFRFSVMDDSASSDLYAYLRRVGLTTGTVDTIAGGALIGWDSPTPVEAYTTNIADGTEVVSNAYAYYITLCFPPSTYSEILFYGARLFYAP